MKDAMSFRAPKQIAVNKITMPLLFTSHFRDTDENVLMTITAERLKDVNAERLFLVFDKPLPPITSENRSLFNWIDFAHASVGVVVRRRCYVIVWL